MIPFGMIPKQIEEKKVEKPTGVAMACIKKRDGRSYCGRDVTEAREYMFADAGHAVRHYRTSTFLMACPKCVAECEAAGVVKTNFIVPMALRDIKENDR